MQYHFPGTNYLGPGTHIRSNVFDRKYPTSRSDTIALYHDINYLYAGNRAEDIAKADLKAISKSDLSIQGAALRAGLTLRMGLRLKENDYQWPLEARGVAYHLRSFLDNDESWKQALQKYDVGDNNYIW